jgi:spermidine/putrescine transport system permease protein
MRRVDLRSFPGFASVSWLVLAVLYLPLVVVVIYSFNSNRVATRWEGFSLSWYEQVFTDDDIRRVTLNSLQVAVVATVVSVVLAVGAAVALQRLGRLGRGYAGLVIGAPLVIPEIVLAVATLALFVALDVDLGLGTVTLAHIAFCVPFAFLPIRARLQDMDPAVFEAAADLGANEWRILARITLPLMGPGVVSGALLAFIISLDDFLISYFVAGPGGTTLPVYLYGQIRNAITPAINAVSTLLLLVTVVILTTSYLLGRTRRARPSTKGTPA